MITPEGKLGLALVTGTMVFGIYQIQMPPASDVRTIDTENPDVQASERAATWTAAAAVAGISLISKSPEVFTMGGILVIAMAWTYRHADQVSPITKKASGYLTAEGIAHAQMPEAATAPAATMSYSTVI